MSLAEPVDFSADCYGVERRGPGAFVVRHFPTRSARKPCCVVEATAKGGESDVDTLERARRLCERKHAE